MSEELKLKPCAELTTLATCPIGLFYSGDELCLKTEYGSNEGRIDAYIVSSGEFFWGSQPQTIENQRKQLVAPVIVTRVTPQPDTCWQRGICSCGPECKDKQRAVEAPVTDEDVVERVARAIWTNSCDPQLVTPAWEHADRHMQDMFKRYARAALNALAKEEAGGVK